MQAAIRRFLSFCALDRGLAPSTVRRYACDLAGFAAFLLTIGLTRTVDLLALHLSAFAVHLGKTCAPRTHRYRLVLVRAFCRWLRAEGLIPAPLVEGCCLPQMPARLPPCLTLSQVDLLLAQPDPATPRGLRDLALLALLYGAGLRVEELCTLRLAALRGPVLCVRGKGDKERLVPYGAAQAVVTRYLQEARPALLRGGACPFVFLTRRSGRPRAISTCRVREIVTRCARAAKLPRRVWPHLLRHTFASHLLWGGADLRAIAAMLGHESLSSTEVYTHLPTRKLWAVYRKHHPRAA